MPNVKVACHVVNGLMIRLFKRGWDDGTGDGVAPMVVDGPGVRLTGIHAIHAGAGNTEAKTRPPGITEIDGEWFDRWLVQNQQNPFVKDGMIHLLKEDVPPVTGENPTRLE